MPPAPAIADAEAWKQFVCDKGWDTCKLWDYERILKVSSK